MLTRFVEDEDFGIIDSELLPDLEKTAFDREIGSAPLAVGLRFCSVGESSSDNDGVFGSLRSPSGRPIGSLSHCIRLWTSSPR